MRTRKTGPDDIPALKALWVQAFGDTDAEIDSFFKTVYPEATGFCAEEDGAVIALLFALPRLVLNMTLPPIPIKRQRLYMMFQTGATPAKAAVPSGP